jgi:DNA mismatch repair protein MutS
LPPTTSRWTDLSNSYPGAFNLNVAVEEAQDGIVFLRKIRPGVADKSYGIHVARLAGLPREALKQAEKKLRELEVPSPAPKVKSAELDLFTLKETPPENPLLDELEVLDPNTLTPLEALQKIAEWKKHGVRP